MKVEWIPRNLIPTVLVIVSAATAPAVANDEQDCFQGTEPRIRIEACSKLILKLTRFRGHPTFWVEGVHDVEAKTTLPT
jgi:hypothetical protein